MKMYEDDPPSPGKKQKALGEGKVDIMIDQINE